MMCPSSLYIKVNEQLPNTIDFLLELFLIKKFLSVYLWLFTKYKVTIMGAQRLGNLALENCSTLSLLTIMLQ